MHEAVVVEHHRDWTGKQYNMASAVSVGQPSPVQGQGLKRRRLKFVCAGDQLMTLELAGI